MRFTEHELTSAVVGAAKDVLAAQDKDVRKGRVAIDDLWNDMDRYQRYVVLDQVATQVLPVLTALPDVEVEFGQRPEYSSAEITGTVEGLVGDEGGRLKRKVVVQARVELVRRALGHVPPRTDPDTLTVPDHL
jgi:hypothetical protein